LQACLIVSASNGIFARGFRGRPGGLFVFGFGGLHGSVAILENFPLEVADVTVGFANRSQSSLEFQLLFGNLL
jgi:hypothetical protein